LARFIGIEIPDDKKVRISLTYLFGIGRPAALQMLNKSKIDPDKRTKDLTEDEQARLRAIIEGMKLEGELRQEISSNIRRMIEIRCYRGLRHKVGLPVRGQRTRHNARTRKGKNLAIGGLKRKLEKT
jgi:small subunit ribosomal protein S13